MAMCVCIVFIHTHTHTQAHTHHTHTHTHTRTHTHTYIFIYIHIHMHMHTYIHTCTQVMASCSADKTIKIWDCRKRDGAAISVLAATNDVNVITWSAKVNSNFLWGKKFTMAISSDSRECETRMFHMT